eukprot:508550-Rhodomonas_salina.2
MEHGNGLELVWCLTLKGRIVACNQQQSSVPVVSSCSRTPPTTAVQKLFFGGPPRSNIVQIHTQYCDKESVAILGPES